VHSFDARGTFREIDHRGHVFHGTVTVTFSDDLLSFSGGTYQGTEKTTSLSGHKQ
jgi:hypothetical protein